MDRAENHFERRVRESEEALLRRVPRGKRPFTETWSCFFLLTAGAWAQVAFLGWDIADGSGVDGHRLGFVAILAVGGPAFAVARKRQDRKRDAAHENASLAWRATGSE